MSYPSEQTIFEKRNTEAEIGNMINSFSMHTDGQRAKLNGSSEVDEDSGSLGNVSEFLAEYCGTSSDSSPQLCSQATSLDSVLFTEAKSDDSPDGNLSDSLSAQLSETEAPTSADSVPDLWSQVSSSSDMFSLGKREDSNSGQSTKDWKQNALRYPPCAVCTGKSSGLHYGCYTCEACKNFFRRYLLRSGAFNCKKNNNCVISNKSRGNCSGCRLKKCLEVGMSKEKSKIGRYTHSQRTETIKEVNKLEGKFYRDEVQVKQENGLEQLQTENLAEYMNETVGCQTVSEPTSVGEVPALTESEKELLAVLSESLDTIDHFGERGRTPEGRKQIINEHYDRYLAKVKLIGPLRAIPKDEYFTLLKLYNIDLDGRWTLFKQEANNCAHVVERYCKFAYKIPGFQSLSVNDQETLLKIGHCEFFVILMHEGYDHEKQIYLEMNGVPAHVEEAADKIFSRELIEMQTVIFQRWQKADLMKEEKTLLCAMSLLCSDRVNLENPSQVEKIHGELTDLLLKVLQINYGKEAEKRFAKFIDILTFCRQASDAYYKEYQEMSQFDMIQEVAPAFPTLCPDRF